MSVGAGKCSAVVTGLVTEDCDRYETTTYDTTGSHMMKKVANYFRQALDSETNYLSQFCNE